MLRSNLLTSEFGIQSADEEVIEESSDEDEIMESDEEADTKTVPNWDQFKVTPQERESISMADTSIVDISIQLLKLVAYVITFGFVLTGAVLAKSILLVMTSQLTPGRTVSIQTGSMHLGLVLPDVEKYLWIWALLITFSAPELAVLIRSIRIAIFKGYVSKDETPESEFRRKTVSSKYVMIVLFTMETCHVIGLAIFVFEVLPQLDVVKGVILTNCVCIVPAILSLVPPNVKLNPQKFKLISNIFALLFQFIGLIAWPVIFGNDNARLWLIPFSLFLISCTWWTNYVSEESPIGFVRFLSRIKEKVKENNVLLYKLYIGISVWKMLLFFSSSLFILSLQGFNILDFFQKTFETFGKRDMMAFVVNFHTRTTTNQIYPVPSISTGIWWIIGLQILSAFICYIFGVLACKVMIQRFSFALPCALVVPVTVSLIIVSTGIRNQDMAAFNSILPNYIFFNSPQIYNAKQFFINEYAFLWIFWVISQILITFHIWVPRCERLSKTDKLFAAPFYSAFFVDQSLALNRRRDEVEILENKETIPPHIIACVTMWHESKPEMLEMLKSLLRLDIDQCFKKMAMHNNYDPEAISNYYTFEAHIFFDDTFEVESEESTKMVINGFVREFLKCMREATEKVYGSGGTWLKPPLKYPTPYGGRLEYTMPCENKLYVHLKNKDKVRHKKRWSQVMYMYYLLGYQIMEQPIPYEQKMKKAENTFLLALDGDIDFKPEAVLLLVDLMKKNENLGAACGRIHPVGTGLMAWYQLFEYAIGHWLQKATEHAIGCVLCSPGCFSLFRGKALMMPNVMKRYTTKAEEARQLVQYDQGEDRWLCTLLLQRGYRVEYSAASDAYTHCPEAFEEFYNQRRRWVPSTLANIIDLLSDYKHTVQVNNDISLPYIAYQMLILAGNILGPGTILLMLVGAFNSAFKVDNWTALYLNLIPILAFILCCLFTPPKFQVLTALVISLMYGLVMMAVLVGVTMEIKDNGFLSPSSLFLIVTAGEIVVAGILHPQEIFCLFSGVIYYVTIPSMYLLLIIYSFCNLHIVSWGTREVAKKKTKAELENEKKEAELAEKKAQKFKLFGVLDTFSSKENKDESGALEFSLSNIFKCMCCTREKVNPTTDQYVKIGETLNGLKKKLDDIERIVQQGNSESVSSRISIKGKELMSPSFENKSKEFVDLNIIAKDSDEENDDESRNDLFNPYWIEDKDLRKSKFMVLSSQEITFWEQLIKNYLQPIIEDKEKKAEITKNLFELRDKVVVTFFMLNALFVVVVFLLQTNKDQIHIKWPLEAKANITFNKVTYEITITKTYLQLEPVGLIFLSFFASILILQFIGMLCHRFETLCHLLSNTPLTILQGKKMTFKDKIERAKKQFNTHNTKTDPNKREINDEASMDFQSKSNLVQRRKSQAMNPDQMINSIILQNKDREREAEEKEERRTSLFPWRKASYQERRMSRQTGFTNLALDKINE